MSVLTLAMSLNSDADVLARNCLHLSSSILDKCASIVAEDAYRETDRELGVRIASICADVIVLRACRRLLQHSTTGLAIDWYIRERIGIYIDMALSAYKAIGALGNVRACERTVAGTFERGEAARLALSDLSQDTSG